MKKGENKFISEHHDAEATHAFAGTGSAATNVQYKLALSGPPNYDTDDWLQPEEIESFVSGLVVRPVGSPRLVWGKAPYPIMSNTGEIDSSSLTEPRIAVDPYDGKHGGGDYRDTSIKARNVFVCFSATGGNPGPNWNMDWDRGGLCPWVKYYDHDECADPPPEEDPDRIRDPDDLDLVPTIIFKQVDP